ncbi:MAG: peptide chain release factor N(5)-glutamine methyltransferase [Alphaproteobacteria bacterium]
MASSPKTLGSVYKYILECFFEGNIESSEYAARMIITERTSYDWSDLIVWPDKNISEDSYKLICRDVEQRLSGVPLSRIYGTREFWGLPFTLSKDTLDPRPDTELIIDLALQRFDVSKPLRILDLGTGSGCILVSLLHEFKNAFGVGGDLSFGSISCARNNAVRNQCSDRSTFFCGSWLESIQGSFDLIVSNPPYISNQVIPTLSQEVQNHDPILALDGGDDGLSPYKNLFPILSRYLNKGGIALFEIGYDQENSVMRLAEESGFAQRTVHMDLAGNPRVVEISSGDK